MEEGKAEQTAPKQQPVKKKVPGRPFKKGQSGNPKGRPAGTISITTSIKAKLLEIYPKNQAVVLDDKGVPITNKEKRTYLEKVIETIFDNAIEQKDSRTLKDIWSYIDGHPKATIDIGADKDSLEELTDFFRAIGKKK